MLQSSPEIQWGVIRTHSSFLVKRNGLALSREAGNLRNKHCFKHSSVQLHHVASLKDNSLVLRKHNVATSLNASANYLLKLKANAPAACRGIQNCLEYYRPDLKRDAAARVSRLLAKQKKMAQKKFKGRK